MFKITFNKPAYKMFFAGEDAAGIRIKVEDRTVRFKPVQKLGMESDVVALTEKHRGGAESFIEGSKEAQLFELLTNPLGNPYFILRRAPGGWMEAIPHPGPKHAPERWEPHIRVWPLEIAQPAVDTETTSVTLRTTKGMRTELPASEEVRETLQQLETTLSGLTTVSFGTAFAAVHSAQALINRFLSFCQEHPLPNQKPRKSRNSRTQRTARTAPARRQRDRVLHA